jgi:PhnB protein
MKIHEVFPYLRVRGADRAIEYYKQVFGAEERFRISEPSGRVGHCELVFGTAVIMVSEEYPELGILGPESVGGASSSIHLHVDDADALIARAAEAGATVLRPPTDAPHGERGGAIRDPFGHEWLIGHQLEELSPAEMQSRYAALYAAADE